MEQSIGATELRQRLTDVLQSVREGGETYIVETFDRAQAALINLDDYQRFQSYQQAEAAPSAELEVPATPDAGLDPSLSYEEVLAIIDQVRKDVASGAFASGEQMEVVEAIAHLFEVAFQRGRSDARTLAFERILARATDLGVTDISEQHDHYLYGIDKR